MYKRATWITTIVILAVFLAGCVVPAAPTPAAPTAGATTAAAATSPAATEQPAAAALASPTAPPAASTPPAQATASAGGAKRTLTVMTHDSFSVSKEVLDKFQAQCDCQVTFLKSGDAGLALNKAILSKGNPLADVLYGVDNTFLSRALNAGIFESYASPALAQVPADFKLDPGNFLLPVDYGYVNINYDKAYFASHKLAIPQTLRDLTKPEYKGLLVVENPATSSPGLAFLLTTIAAFGEQGSYTYLNFWRDLRANDALVADGWENAYNGQFSAGSGKGDRPLVVSYATDPAAEVYFADPHPADSPVGNILQPGESFRQVEFVGILKGAREPDLARQWVDFMLGEALQADVPLQMWVYPVRTGTPLPDVFTQFAQVPTEPAKITPEQIEAGRDKWLQAWTDAVLH